MAKAKRKHGRSGQKRELKEPVLGELIRKNPKLLAVLDKHGVTFCAGCYLTLFSPPERVAAYHAVPNLKKFLGDLKRKFKS